MPTQVAEISAFRSKTVEVGLGASVARQGAPDGVAQRLVTTGVPGLAGSLRVRLEASRPRRGSSRRQQRPQSAQEPLGQGRATASRVHAVSRPARDCHFCAGLDTVSALVCLQNVNRTGTEGSTARAGNGTGLEGSLAPASPCSRARPRRGTGRMTRVPTGDRARRRTRGRDHPTRSEERRVGKECRL